MSQPRYGFAKLVREALRLGDFAALAVCAAALVSLTLTQPLPGRALAVLAGVLLWIPAEYLHHRFVLHLPRLPWPWAWRLQKRAHAKHHRVPDDPRSLFIPWWLSPVLIATGGAIVAAVLGWSLWLPAACGHALALVHYELTHFSAHVPYHPHTPWGRAMKRHHLLHHFKNERYWFGVTTPLCDLLLRTWPSPDAVPRSRTARDLAGERDGGDQSG